MVQIIVENFVEHAGLPKRSCNTHFLFRKILKENGWIFFHDSFGIELTVVQNIFENIVKHGQSPKGAWQDHAQWAFSWYDFNAKYGRRPYFVKKSKQENG